jgi:ethanolamine utilization protein EutN
MLIAGCTINRRRSSPTQRFSARHLQRFVAAGVLTDRRQHSTVAALTMYMGIVKGTIVASVKADGLAGQKLLLVQPVDDAMRPNGELHAAVDTVQAGVGDLVYLVGSREAALALTPHFVPVDAAIVGIVDGVDAQTPASHKGAQ